MVSFCGLSIASRGIYATRSQSILCRGLLLDFDYVLIRSGGNTWGQRGVKEGKAGEPINGENACLGRQVLGFLEI